MQWQTITSALPYNPGNGNMGPGLCRSRQSVNSGRSDAPDYCASHEAPASMSGAFLQVVLSAPSVGIRLSDSCTSIDLKLQCACRTRAPVAPSLESLAVHGSGLSRGCRTHRQTLLSMINQSSMKSSSEAAVGLQYRHDP